MSKRKAVLEKSHDALIEKADHCGDVAKAQRAIADKQHESACKLEKLSAALEADAAEIQEELDADADPRPREQPSKEAA